MALLLYDSLYPSSFKGAKFWYQSGDISSGRKTVIHEYPNKDFRFVEDLGRNLRIIEIQAIIKGDAYLIDKERLEAALNTPGIGILVHPFLGNINVYPTGYTVTEPINQVGVANFSINFAETSENISPRVTGNNTALIANLYRDLYDKVDESINLEWTLNFIRNIEDAVQVMQRVIDKLKALARISNSFIDGRNQFTKTADNFDDNKYRAAQDSEVLGSNFTDTIGDFDGLTLDAQSRFDINRNAFGVGANDTFSNLKTSITFERNKNRKLLNGVFNLLILNDLYVTATLLDYLDEIQLDNTQIILDQAFFDLTTNENYLIDNTLINAITAIRNEVRKFFDNLRLTIAKVTTVQTPTIPTTVLSFNYYGSTDNYQEILDLNNITNPAVINGEIRILEQ